MTIDRRGRTLRSAEQASTSRRQWRRILVANSCRELSSRSVARQEPLRRSSPRHEIDEGGPDSIGICRTLYSCSVSSPDSNRRQPVGHEGFSAPSAPSSQSHIPRTFWFLRHRHPGLWPAPDVCDHDAKPALVLSQSRKTMDIGKSHFRQDRCVHLLLRPARPSRMASSDGITMALVTRPPAGIP
jgi:hypothetical protein